MSGSWFSLQEICILCAFFTTCVPYWSVSGLSPGEKLKEGLILVVRTGPEIFQLMMYVSVLLWFP